MAATIIEDTAARNEQLSSIIADPIFAPAGETAADRATVDDATTDGATAAIQLLTRSAFTCLSRVEAVSRVSGMGVRPISNSDTFLAGIEEVAPVTKRKVRPLHFSLPKPILTHIPPVDNRF